MTPEVIIREAAADGVSLALSPAGTIKATGDQAAVNHWLPVLREHKPAILAALASRDPPGVSSEFAARLSAEDLEDIAAGDIPLGTVQAFEQAAIAREAEDLKEFFEERSAILEVDLGRPDAELEGCADHGDPRPEPRLPVGVPTGGALGIPRPGRPGCAELCSARFKCARHAETATSRPAMTGLEAYVRRYENFVLVANDVDCRRP